MENTKTYEFKISAGAMIQIGGIPVTLKDDVIIESATDFLSLPREFMPQYKFSKAPMESCGVITMRGEVEEGVSSQ